jgi:hypothetical protein
MKRSFTVTRREPVPRIPSVSQLSMISYWSRRIVTQRVSIDPSSSSTIAPPMKCVAASHPEL